MLQIQDFEPETLAMVALTRQLAEIESPTTDKASVDRLGRFVAEQVTALGAEVSIQHQDTAGNHVLARWRGPDSGNRHAPILILCHMDTVWGLGTLERLPLREAEGKLYGPGVYDMKGGIALALTALRLLRANAAWPSRAVTALFTSDEETGSNTSRQLIETLAREAGLALVLEPAMAGGALKTARKGTGEIEIVVHGRAAHAGADHQKGRNAIEELAHHVLSVQRLTDYSAGTTVNVGLISGGTRSNVVPDAARAVADVRVAVSEEAVRVQRWAASVAPVLHGTSVRVHVTFDRPPMPRDARMTATFACARSIGRRLGLDLTEGSTGGASDGNFVAALGTPLLDGLGPVGDGGHAEHEHIITASLPERAALLAAILTEWP
jgi:glutamate carboxypeptidase